MKFDKAIPILYSADVAASVAYFTECLKFDEHWMWDDSPSFGGVHRDRAEIFFCKGDQGNPGTWLSLVVDNVDEYYALVRDGGAVIISPPDTKPWNMREMLIRCPDDHVIRIGHKTSCD